MLKIRVNYLISGGCYNAYRESENEGQGGCKKKAPPRQLNLLLQENAERKGGGDCYK